VNIRSKASPKTQQLSESDIGKDRKVISKLGREMFVDNDCIHRDSQA
jgi:hypothetical protein